MNELSISTNAMLLSYAVSRLATDAQAGHDYNVALRTF